MTELSAALPAHLTERPEVTNPKAKNALGKDDFMKLLMAQLTHQDPLKPMEHQEFSAQLAQFGQLEQLTNIHKSLEGLQGGIGSEAKMSALSMIGKRVEAAGNEVQLVEGEGVALKYNRREGVAPIKATVYSDGGKPVRELTIDPRQESSEVQWDGKDAEGKSMPAGRYSFRISGVDNHGQAQELTSQLSGKVTSVDMDGTTPTLIVDTGAGTARMELSRVKSVSVDTGTPTTSANMKPSPTANAKVSQQPTESKPTVQASTPSAPSILSPNPVEESERNAVTEEGNGSPIEDQWRGFPPFASFESLKP